MPKHDDNDPVLVGYDSSRNVTFNGQHEELGYTWGDWREMTQKERDDTLEQYLWELVDVYVEDNEEME